MAEAGKHVVLSARRPGARQPLEGLVVRPLAGSAWFVFAALLAKAHPGWVTVKTEEVA
jgi:hypothetical protein